MSRDFRIFLLLIVHLSTFNLTEGVQSVNQSEITSRLSGFSDARSTTSVIVCAMYSSLEIMMCAESILCKYLAKVLQDEVKSTSEF